MRRTPAARSPVYELRKVQDLTLHWLQHAADTQDGGVIEVREDPFLLVYKDDPRYITIARKVGVMTDAEAALAMAETARR